MAAPYYHLKVVTPKGTALDAEVIHTQLPGENGYLGVLAHHAALVTSSAGGRLSVQTRDGAERRYKIGPGFFEVSRNQAMLLVQSFQEF